MANVWKVGSRWSDYGAKEKYIVSVFRRNNVVFVGNDNADRFLHKVKAGDYFAVADGYKIIAVAKAIKDAETMENIKTILSERERDILVYGDESDFTSHSNGVKVKLIDLKPTEQLYYQKRSSFCIIKDETLKEQVINKFENHEKLFSIQSQTYTLFGDEKTSILDGKTKYIIPVYQRPYSWSEKQLEPFVNDIFKGFGGIEKNKKLQESIFIGTMQLSEKKFIDKNEYEQHIIDGQQRLSTFLVLLKVLKILYPENVGFKNIPLNNWLETRVGDEQEEYLTSFLNLSEIKDVENAQSPYLRNALIVKKYFEQNIDSENDIVDFQIDDFIHYLATKIYFIVIETYAGISKTLQIFNAINTTGLDLNGGDIFKVRMYEYLTDKKNEGEEVFQKITKLYDLIDSKNKSFDVEVTSINETLDIYRDYLIARYDLPVVLFDYASETFFDHLFDALLGINQWEYLRNIKELELRIDELEDIINVRFEWEKSKYISVENMFALNSIRWSRYSKYWKSLYVLLYVQRNLSVEERYENVALLLVNLNKLFFIYSVINDKVINDMRYTFMRNLKKRIVNDTFDNMISSIKEKINATDKEWTKDCIGGYITYNPRKRNLICVLSAFLDETANNIKKTEEIHKKLFETRFDIEHIHANNDTSIAVDAKLQNSIGNLVMLEGEINRSIQDEIFEEKKKRYLESCYNSVQKIACKNNWTEVEIKERKEDELRKIIDYLYDQSSDFNALCPN